MQITRLKLKNWRNFTYLDVKFQEITYILGANASGKSNLLDIFRFLRDISKPQGGGLQAAIIERGGISKLRCLHARRDPDVLIEVELSESGGSNAPVWRYAIAFKPEGKGKHRTFVSKEEVWHNGKKIVSRPDDNDKNDPALLTQTALEQIAKNANFRPLVDFFSTITYLHLVPQLLKFSDQIGGRRLENDPFGQGFLERIAKTQERTRLARLRKINAALKLAVPQFEELRFRRDDTNGHPHLEARYSHHRPNAGWQSEEHLSDGTLRLIGLLWSFLEGSSMLLLEEPEISLNEAIIKQIPLIMNRLQKNKKLKRQIVISTHSDALLSNPGIDGRGVIFLETGKNGSTGRGVEKSEEEKIKAGFSIAEVVLPKTRPELSARLGAWQ